MQVAVTTVVNRSRTLTAVNSPDEEQKAASEMQQAYLELEKDLEMLSVLKHPNIVLFLGACTQVESLSQTRALAQFAWTYDT